MITNIEVSVVIPMYNAETTIISCINSVVFELQQINLLWEIWVIDDGSKDHSFCILSNYVQQHSMSDRIFLIRQNNKGVSAARNVGIKKARGRYILFNDSDDCWIPGRVLEQLSLFESHPEISLITGVYRNMSIVCDGSVKELNIMMQLFKNHVSPTTTMIKREVISIVGLFNESMICGEDVDFFNRILRHGRGLLVCTVYAECISKKHSWGDSGLSSKLWLMEKGELINLYHIYKYTDCSFTIYLIATVYSLLKYIRRYVMSNLRSIRKAF